MSVKAGTASLLNVAAAAGEGDLDIDCDWVDQDALESRLAEIAEADGEHDVFDSVEVFGAILILKLFARTKQNAYPLIPDFRVKTTVRVP